jgi:hypothetical protein
MSGEDALAHPAPPRPNTSISTVKVSPSRNPIANTQLHHDDTNVDLLGLLLLAGASFLGARKVRQSTALLIVLGLIMVPSLCAGLPIRSPQA